MNVPAISVILPVFNSEAYISRAVQSVLEQTFTDFELIIINDGSTDKTEFQVLSFPDPRIVYIKNKENKGLIFSLNRAVEISKGNYIARMDADDICRPGRLMTQKKFLDENTDITILASTVTLINEREEETGEWELDKQMITQAAIRKIMPCRNCIAHPTVMIRSEVLKNEKYRSTQKNIEDYDLWLRLLNRKYKIAKLKEPLLLYRIHDESVTSTGLKKKNIFFKQLGMKRRFLAAEIFSGRVNWFTLRVAGSALADLLKGIIKALKKRFR